MSTVKYPPIIPELDYSGSDQTKINTSNFKYFLLSTFFYERVKLDEKIYLKLAFSGKLHYMPLFTMTKALAHYNDSDYENFEKVSKALINSMDKYGWLHENLMQLPGHPKKFKSYSALNNGRGLGVLIRYYSKHPSAELLDKIKNVLKSFEILSSEGGVLSKDGEYLEYSWGDNSPIVWNGFMSALIGLYDCYLHGPKEVRDTSKELFDKGIEKLVFRQDELFIKINNFEWIKYDDNKLYFADGPYIKIETRQLEYLSNIDKRLEKSLIKIKEIGKKYPKMASRYEYYYFIKKRLMK
ncbi:D-glucuronyl C5-epimerase family protein [Methanococcus maripaludis]|uniref:D-glucuronyl C5-epimerase C-terminal domain-containing protein n=1 Tax=Methanococcus maripaludis TaxID=39152 RepID=A0A7J9PEH6_METMI|nr:D-glucuronyl C5-epimerase family protein [Methanococcus maripaludis]MBA2859849.1 hypothetical protein [Methanococcus maripaludis]